MIRGKLRSAVRWITDREKGGLFRPEEIPPKTGQHILKVLHWKHPEARPLTASSSEAYQVKPPTLVPVDIINETVANVARKFSGSAGTGGTESVILQHWLLNFGAASMGIQQIVG